MTDATHYLYTLRPARLAMLSDGPTPEEAASTEAHFNYLKDLIERDILVLAGRTLNTDASSFGIVNLKAGSEQAARAIMENDPGVKGGVMCAELYPYRIALMRVA
jgi:uncharacterized protein YciI